MQKQNPKELISHNLSVVQDKIKTAAEKNGRTYQDIDLMVVTKTWSPDIISQVIENGITLLGENRIQEAVPKVIQLNEKHQNLEWHMVGHLQSNKAKAALEHFHCIQSVDSIKIAQRIARLAERENRQQNILVELNISGEAAKYGIDPDDIFSVTEEILKYPALNLKGLMTVGPLTRDQEKIRQAFKTMKQLFCQLKDRYPENAEILSMGMSDDFEIAIEEGATMVRLGRAIFGPREG